jgi:hypothetical protein
MEKGGTDRKHARQPEGPTGEREGPPSCGHSTATPRAVGQIRGGEGGWWAAAVNSGGRGEPGTALQPFKPPSRGDYTSKTASERSAHGRVFTRHPQRPLAFATELPLRRVKHGG